MLGHTTLNNLVVLVTVREAIELFDMLQIFTSDLEKLDIIAGKKG
jgi:hypothetical protein